MIAFAEFIGPVLGGFMLEHGLNLGYYSASIAVLVTLNLLMGT